MVIGGLTLLAFEQCQSGYVLVQGKDQAGEINYYITNNCTIRHSIQLANLPPYNHRLAYYTRRMTHDQLRKEYTKVGCLKSKRD